MHRLSKNRKFGRTAYTNIEDVEIADDLILLQTVRSNILEKKDLIYQRSVLTAEEEDKEGENYGK